jgi:hypothetical protein
MCRVRFWLIVAFVLAVTPAYAAISVGTAVACGNAGGGSAVCTGVVATAGGAIIVFYPANGSGAQPVTCVDDKSDTFTELAHIWAPVTQPYIAALRANNVVGGTTQVTCSDPDDLDKEAIAIPYSGQASSSDIADTDTNAADTGTTASTPAVTGTVGGMVFACMTVFDSLSLTPAGGWTQDAENELFTFMSFNCAHKTSTGSDAPAVTIGGSGGQWAMATVLVNAAGAASGGASGLSLRGIGR